MKIGIVSMQRIVNYGSFLQAYGLKSVLESYGHEIIFLDYKPGSVLHAQSDNSISKLKNSLKAYAVKSSIIHLIRISIYTVGARFSKKYTNKKSAAITSRKLQKNYKIYLNKYLGANKMRYVTNEPVDLLVVGSDEVFNCLQSNPDVGYSLDLFGINSKSKYKATYAASFGNTTLPRLKEAGVKEEVSQALLAFSYLSARDNNSKEILEQLTDQSVNKNIDPVLLYDFKSELSAVTINTDQFNDYMIVYAYAGRLTKDEVDSIVKFANQKSLKIMSIGSYNSFADYSVDASPFELLSYVKAAKFVVTDTFHGTIYSIKMNTPFVTIVRKSVAGAYGNEEKLSDLLNTFNMSSRRAYDESDIEAILSTKVTFLESNAILKKEQEKSLEYLGKVLSHDKKY